MLIVVGTDSSDEYNNENYDVAVVDIGENEAKKLMSLIGMFESTKQIEPGLSQMNFDSDKVALKCSFYTDIWSFSSVEALPPMSAEIKGVLQNELPYAVIPEDVELLSSQENLDPESVEVQITDAGFAWVAYPKDSTVIVWSRVLPRSLLTKLI